MNILKGKYTCDRLWDNNHISMWLLMNMQIYLEHVILKGNYL